MRQKILVGVVGVALGLIACGSHSSSSSTDAAGNGDGGGDAAVPTVAVTITNHPTTASTFEFLVAYQDGSAAWKLAPAPAGDVYTLPIASGRYGVAWTCVTATGAARVVAATYSTVTEHPSLTIDDVPAACTDRITTVNLTGAITNRGTGMRYSVSFGDVNADASAAGDYLLKVPAGTHDLIVAESMAPAVAGGGTPDLVVDKVAVQRGLAVTAATAAPATDFSTAAAVQSYVVTATVTGTPRVTANTVLYTNGTTATLVRDATTPYESVALATAQGATSDVYEQSITVTDTIAAATVSNITATPAAQTYAAPPALGGALVTTAAAAPYPQLSTTWTAYANAVGYTWTGDQALTTQCGGALAACTLEWSAQLTTGWLGTATVYQMPDLSALVGWSAELQPTAGVMMTGVVRATTSTAGAADFPAATPPAAGTQRVLASSSWTATP